MNAMSLRGESRRPARRVRRAVDGTGPSADVTLRAGATDRMHIGYVLGADDDQRGRPDLRQAHADGRVERADLRLRTLLQGLALHGERVELHAPNGLAHVGRNGVGAAPRPVDPEAKVELGHGLAVAPLEGLVLGVRE